MHKPRKSHIVVAILAIAALLAAACAREEEAEIPELADGVLQVGSDITWAPFEFFEGGSTTPTGFDVELFEAIAEELDVEVEWISTDFGGIIPALQAKRFDVIVSGMTASEERDEVIDFVPYYFAGITLIVPKGNPEDIHSLDDLSGLTVSAQIGTTWQNLLEAKNDEFRAAGRPLIDIQLYDSDPLAVDQLRLGRVDANMNDNPVADYIVSLEPELFESLSGEILEEAAPFGWGIRETSPELKEALDDAIRRLIRNGTYDRIITKWGLEGGTIVGRGVLD